MFFSEYYHFFFGSVGSTSRFYGYRFVSILLLRFLWQPSQFENVQQLCGFLVTTDLTKSEKGMKRIKLFLVRKIARIEPEIDRLVRTELLNIPRCCYPYTVSELKNCWRKVEETKPVYWSHVAVYIRMLDFLSLPPSRKRYMLEWIREQNMSLPSLPWLLVIYMYNYIRAP